jgi:hypothetical protein
MHKFIRVTETGTRRWSRQHTHATTGRTGPDVIRFDDRYRLARAGQFDCRDNPGLAATDYQGVATIWKRTRRIELMPVPPIRIGLRQFEPLGV